MPTTPINTPSDGVIEHDGMLWKPTRGATTSFKQFIAARTTFREISQDSRWNPWIRDDRHDEYEQAVAVMDQWRRAEPGHRMLTTRQLEARWARQDRERERALQKLKTERERRRKLHDPARADARLSLLEQQSRLEYETTELASYEDGSRYPKKDVDRRRQQMDELRASIGSRQKEIARLTPIVGDPETVIDENGWLPKERRDAMLIHYRFDRERAVRQLRAQIPELVATGDRNDRIEADLKRHRLDKLLAVPPLTADDMCSDCAAPIAEHGSVTPPFDGPCPAWPGWRARLQRAWQILEVGARDRQTSPTEPSAPKSQPLATIPSGLPIAEVTKRLQDLQAEFPDAEVRRGRANRWELWPAESPD